MNEGLYTIFPPTSLDEVLGQVASFAEDKYQALLIEARGLEGFDTTKDRCVFLAHKLSISAESAALLMSALSYLYTRIKDVPEGEARQVLKELADGFDDPKLEGDRSLLVSRLAELVAPSVQIDHSRKLSRLRSGFLKNAIGFGSFVDVRPDFDKGNSIVRGFVPIVQFRITTDSDNSSEREVIFQIDESGLAALSEAVRSAETKLSTIKTSNLLAAPLYTRTRSTDE